jgi:hypothetical protein
MTGCVQKQHKSCKSHELAGLLRNTMWLLLLTARRALRLITTVGSSCTATAKTHAAAVAEGGKLLWQPNNRHQLFTSGQRMKTPSCTVSYLHATAPAELQQYSCVSVLLMGTDNPVALHTIMRRLTCYKHHILLW